jgi:hypothetical protein
MAAGDIKGTGDEVVIYVTAGAAVTKGQGVHMESDDHNWDPVTDADKGKFGVALETADSGAEFPTLIKGKVEVTASGTIYAGGVVMAAAGGTFAMSDHGQIGENAGTAMTGAANGATFTLYVGLVE